MCFRDLVSFRDVENYHSHSSSHGQEWLCDKPQKNKRTSVLDARQTSVIYIKDSESRRLWITKPSGLSSLSSVSIAWGSDVSSISITVHYTMQYICWHRQGLKMMKKILFVPRNTTWVVYSLQGMYNYLKI